jgi:dTDP-4-dehydrorhamnose reductase
MKYLILGANGLIGQQFVNLCKERGIDYIGTRYSRNKGNLHRINFLEPGSLPGFLDEISPQVVLNCVNLAGGVNFCEENPELARKLHSEATKALVDWCAANHALLIYFSTDYVFDGKNPPYKEDDETGPLNLYGQLKLESEQYIQQEMERYIITRTTNVYGWDPDTPTPNFLMYLYQTLQEGKTFNSPSFLFGNPTYAPDLVKAILELIDKKHYGVFHIVGSGYINRYDWAIKFCELAGLDKDKIIEVKDPPENIVPRPLLSDLNTEKVHAILETKLHNVDEGLQLLIDEMKKDS